MKDELKCTCSFCSSTVTHKDKSVVECKDCGGYLCSKCGGRVAYLRGMYVCRTCLTVYLPCCSKEAVEDTVSSVKVMRCPACRRHTEKRYVEATVDVIRNGHW